MAANYQVVEAVSAAALATAVDILLAAGWTTVGGVYVKKNASYVAGTYGQDAPVYAQSMEK